MNTPEIINLLKESQREIQNLRRVNEVLGAKVQVMDNFMRVFDASPGNLFSGGCVDITFEIEKAVMKLDEEQRKAEDEPKKHC